MSANNNNNSTLKAYVDSATGAVQNVVGNIIGNTGDEAEGKAKQNKAAAEYDASHSAAKVPGGTVSNSGVTSDNPKRTTGSSNQTAGAAKEFVGGVVGNENLKQTGREQNRTGQEQEARGQLKDLGSGVGDRVAGAMGSAAAGLTGDRAKQAEYQDRHDVGKTQQRGAEHDMRKEAEARGDRY